MNKKTKIRIIVALTFLMIYSAIWVILHFTIKDLSNVYVGMIAAGLAVILSPRITNYESQSGNQIQVKWFFIKKILNN
ncbi:hypothetical protein FUA48_09850 [Flavobacterium alkalisoli]|uniref:Uncharacterized protein n=1 Tax=Flavobacterium alkalisoli TaxID=2602769 RepID=A0A5B9FSH6_9FLAO|nr:hypothetical protein [Flavobacterium alkalisoli]QEE49874.1 hypothetical protein FUA48_09850 [Flavobacterium alkalisoli]